MSTAARQNFARSLCNEAWTCVSKCGHFPSRLVKRRFEYVWRLQIRDLGVS